MGSLSISDFQISAALWVVRAVDEGGTGSATLDLVFRNAVTLGRFPRLDLDNALSLLVEHGLVVVSNGRVHRSENLRELLALPDPAAEPLLSTLLAASTASDTVIDGVDVREIVGALGEEAVVAWCVDELRALGHYEIVAQVRRVSLVSDRFGYDVSAPTIGTGPRMLEVKTSMSNSSKTFRFFLSRNEYEVGRRNSRQWAMVACGFDGETATILGWCRASEFERYVPDDGNGRWTEALVNLPRSALMSSVPSAVL
ncbi:protein NO VEIN domain-containing protein [Subtercola lobariae]|uniref:protein NO VEIN domain-containing protein n=1 Tax=Subtercola lobariae TaxID=1588641 RepID=UPI001669630C|nr:DUF3883 domain-containing protein [Subtercola lobariae]